LADSNPRSSLPQRWVHVQFRDIVSSPNTTRTRTIGYRRYREIGGRVCIGNRTYQKAGRGGVLQEQGTRWAVLAVPVQTADRREYSDRKIVSQCRTRQDGHTIVSFPRSIRKFRGNAWQEYSRIRQDLAYRNVRPGGPIASMDCKT
jgi:hypothetical protein